MGALRDFSPKPHHVILSHTTVVPMMSSLLVTIGAINKLNVACYEFIESDVLPIQCTCILQKRHHISHVLASSLAPGTLLHVTLKGWEGLETRLTCCVLTLLSVVSLKLG